MNEVIWGSGVVQLFFTLVHPTETLTTFDPVILSNIETASINSFISLRAILASVFFLLDFICSFFVLCIFLFLLIFFFHAKLLLGIFRNKGLIKNDC